MMEAARHSINVPLKDLLVLQKGKKPSKLSKIRFKDSLPYLDIEALEKNHVINYADSLTSVHSNESDIFMVWDGSRSGLVSKGRVGAVGSTLMCLTPLGVDPLYLFYFLRSKFEYLNKNTTGASIPHINPEIFYSLEVPIVPVEIQKKIVEQLEESITIYEYDFESISSELQRSRQYRQAILEQAITGQLTEGWRKDYKNDLSYSKIYNLSIPSSWKVSKLSEITESVSDGDHQSPKKVINGIPFILISNIQNGVIDFKNTLKVSENYFNALKDFRRPQKDDILFTVVGSIGNVVLINEEPNFCFQRHIALIRPSEGCTPQFLYLQLQSNFIQEQALERSKGVAQLTLNLSELRELNVLVPEPEEQKEIVKLAIPLLEDLGRIIDEHASSLILKDQLKVSVLESAFDPTSLPTNSKYFETNWIEAFFERIKVEKETKEKTIHGIRNKNKTTRIIMKESLGKKPSIITIIENSKKETVPIEEVWQQSIYFSDGDIEGFYEEIETKSIPKKSDKETIAWQFADDNKDQVILKIINHADPKR